jgi:glucose uptake protein GlcU
MMILKNRRAMVATVGAMFAMIFMLFFEPILTPRLKALGFISGDWRIGKQQHIFIYMLKSIL